MDLTMILAESATIHPDGTFSMLRGGINRIVVPALPTFFTATLLIRVITEAGDSGEHKFRLTVVDDDGHPVMPPEASPRGAFPVPQQESMGYFIIGFSIPFKKHGTFQFQFSVDDIVSKTWTLKVVPPPQPPLPAPPQIPPETLPRIAKGG